MANTSRTHACTHARMHAHAMYCAHTHPPPSPSRLSLFDGSLCEVNAHFSPVPLAMNGRSVLHSNKQSRMRRGIRDSFGCFSRIKKLLGRTETRTRDRMCFQSIRTVLDISRDDRARIATCSLLTSTDRLRRIIE